MKIWLDDIRECPDGWLHARSVNEAIGLVRHHTGHGWEAVSLDHDLGDFAYDGGDALKFVLWMAEHGIWPEDKPVVHSMNPVGRKNMEALIERYGPYE